MISADKDLFMCDMVESYGIINYEQLPAVTVAAFAYGLRDDSRIKLKLRGERAPREVSLLCWLIDELRMFRWSLSEDAQNGVSPPEKIYDRLLYPEKFENNNVQWTFEDEEEFDKKWKEINEV